RLRELPHRGPGWIRRVMGRREACPRPFRRTDYEDRRGYEDRHDLLARALLRTRPPSQPQPPSLRPRAPYAALVLTHLPSSGPGVSRAERGPLREGGQRPLTNLRIFALALPALLFACTSDDGAGSSGGSSTSGSGSSSGGGGSSGGSSGTPSGA